MLCRRHTAQQAYEWGLVNAVVPAAELDTEVARWCDDLMALSPTVLKVIKKSIDDAYSGVREQQDRFNVLKQVNAGFFDNRRTDRRNQRLPGKAGRRLLSLA